MQHSFKTVLKNETNSINISHLLPTLRQKQYYNAMCDLKYELETLICIPNIEKNLKIKMKRSLAKVTLLVDKLKEKL